MVSKGGQGDVVKSPLLSRKEKVLNVATVTRDCRWTRSMVEKALAVGLVLFLLLLGCAAGGKGKTSRKPLQDAKRLQRVGFTIQTGAFRSVKNAAEMAQALRGEGVAVTHFKDADGLFRVRIGSFPTHEQALVLAQALQENGTIEEFYIVAPANFSVSQSERLGEDYLREEIVKTAKTFLGVPYLWGGESVGVGFDCSGLAMTVFQLNGIELPRRAADQYRASNVVSLDEIKKGDLLFYKTERRRRLAVTHVGIYIGEGRFIHAPRRKQKISDESIDNAFYKKRFVGAGSFL